MKITPEMIAAGEAVLEVRHTARAGENGNPPFDCVEEVYEAMAKLAPDPKYMTAAEWTQWREQELADMAEKVSPSCEFCNLDHSPMTICSGRIKSARQAEKLEKLANPLLLVPDPARENRIEALRAASRIVAGLLSTGPAVRSPEGMHDVESNTLELAKSFEPYLEGE